MSYYSGKFEINTNLTSLMLQNQFNSLSSDIIKLMERVSTQQRVNSASDDPSGSSLITGYNAQISSMQTAQDNCSKGIALLNTAKSGLTSIQDEIKKMKGYLEIARDSTKSTTQKEEANTKFLASIAAINSYATDTNYNGIKLLDGTNSATGKVVIQVDIKNDASSRLDISSALGAADATTLGINSLKIYDGSTIDLDAVETALNDASSTITSKLSTVGNFATTLDSNRSRLANQAKYLGEARDVILKADTASDTAELTRLQILQQSTATLLQQANSSSALAITLITRY